MQTRPCISSASRAIAELPVESNRAQLPEVPIIRAPRVLAIPAHGIELHAEVLEYLTAFFSIVDVM